MSRHPFSLVLAAFAVLALCCSCTLLSDPEPVASGYLRTSVAGFTYTRDTRSWKMFIQVEPLRQAPGGGFLYLEATFENPQPGSPALVANGDSHQAARTGVKLESTPVGGLQDNKIYVVTVRAYADKAHTRLLDTLRQPVAYRNVGNPETMMRGGPLPPGAQIVNPGSKIR